MKGLVQTQRTRVVQMHGMRRMRRSPWYEKYALIYTGMNWYVQYYNVAS